MYTSTRSPGNNTLLAENLFFPSNFTDVDLPEANVTATYFDLTPLNIIKVLTIKLAYNAEKHYGFIFSFYRILA